MEVNFCCASRRSTKHHPTNVTTVPDVRSCCGSWAVAPGAAPAVGGSQCGRRTAGAAGVFGAVNGGLGQELWKVSTQDMAPHH